MPQQRGVNGPKIQGNVAGLANYVATQHKPFSASLQAPKARRVHRLHC